MTDSHCHIAGEEFIADLEAVVQRAQAAGVSRALVILAADDDAEIARSARSGWTITTTSRPATSSTPSFARSFSSTRVRPSRAPSWPASPSPTHRRPGGKSVVIVANLAPRKMMGQESSGMVLAASPDGGAAIVINAEPATPGTRVR